MEYLMYLVALLVPGVLSMAIVELNQARHLQTDVDMGRPIEHLFEAFKRVYSKQYINKIEESIRMKIFKANVQLIQEHNRQYAKGEKSFYLAVNHFSDLTHKEFVHMFTGHLKQGGNIIASSYLSPDNVLLPENIDWRDHGYVTPVKDQGHVCGSCWAFSTTGSLEGQHFKKTKKLISLSEQQLVDCSGKFGNNGCHGGLMDQAFQYIKSVGGLEDEEDYPYTAKDGNCKFVMVEEKATVTGIVDLPSGDEAKLQEAVATIGPVSVGIDASHPSFQSYAGGVYDEPACNSTNLDHGVLVIGYGTNPSPYWLVKNSWGIGWGEAGYIKMRRNNNNQCGVATFASYPLV